MIDAGLDVSGRFQQIQRKIVKYKQVSPSHRLLTGIKRLGNTLVLDGGYGDVVKGKWDEEFVAVKTLHNFRSDKQEEAKRVSNLFSCARLASMLRPYSVVHS